VEPDIFLFDYAPTAMLAARDSTKSKIIRNSGFGALVPGHGDVELWPQEDSRQLLKRHEAAVTETINQVCRNYNFQPVSHFSDIYACDFSLMSIMPELDEYRRDPERTMYYTLSADFGFPEIRWQDTGRKKIFAYLKAWFEPSLQMLDVLAGGEYEVICYCPGLSKERSESYNADGITIQTELVSLGSILPWTDIVVCHASKGLIVESLLHGIPLLNLPTQIEQARNAKMVERLGAGLTIEFGMVLERGGIASRLAELELDPAYRQAARLVASRNLRPDNEETLDRVVSKIESFIPA
jgi:UDP:flavonoid glycosyltransferase YjiC (YdhE family)